MKNNKREEFKIPKTISKFASKSWKKYWKENKEVFDGKKDGMKEFFFTLQEDLSDVIEFMVQYGHLNAVKDVKNECYKKIINEDFLRSLTKRMKKDDDFAKSMRLFPIVAREIVIVAEEENKRIKAENPNANIYDMSDITYISKMILKKRMKELQKIDGVSEEMAFDLLSIIPCNKVMKFSPVYRIRQLFNALYDWGKDRPVPFKEIIDNLVKEDYHVNAIIFALLEKKEVYSTLTDNQKNLYTDITTWCVNTMEEMKSHTISEIINAYVRARKRDEHNGKDEARRYHLNVLTESDYPNIRKTISLMISDNPDIEKYL